MTLFAAKRTIIGLFTIGEEKTKADWMTALNRTSQQFDDMVAAAIFLERSSAPEAVKGYDNLLQSYIIIFKRTNNPFTSDEIDNAITNLAVSHPDLADLFLPLA